jgi:hypothetical protein
VHSGDESGELWSREVLHLVYSEQHTRASFSSSLSCGHEEIGEILGQDAGVGLSCERVHADPDGRSVRDLEGE